MLNTLKALCEIGGISGREDAVRDYILSRIEGKCEYTVDPLGNILAFKKGRMRPGKTVMLSAHMDEVGMMVTSVCDDGTLRFATVGGVDARVILGRGVTVGEKMLPGVIGAKAIHMTEGEARGEAIPADQLVIDVGAKDREEALQAVAPGDAVCFASDFFGFGDGKIKGRAIDDRFGCAVLICLIESDLKFDMHFAFTVQEEVGLRGARTAAFSIAPDIAFVIEATTAADLPGVMAEKAVCRLGKGPAVSFMDRATVYDAALYRYAFEVARRHGIPCQPKTMVAGGNDAGAISQAGAGARTLAVSIPCRYLHSPCCVIDRADAQHLFSLVLEMVRGVDRL